MVPSSTSTTRSGTRCLGVRRRSPDGAARGAQAQQPAGGPGRRGQGGRRGARHPRRRLRPAEFEHDVLTDSLAELAERPRPDRRADHRGGRAARRHRGHEPRAERVRRAGRGRSRRPRRAGRHRHHQCAAHRRARAVQAGARTSRRDRALAARHHGPHRRADRPRRGARAGRRGGHAPARDRRRPPHPDGAGRRATWSRSWSPAAPTTRRASG